MPTSMTTVPRSPGTWYGVAYDITDNFAVDLGYRYVNLGYYEVDLPEGGKVKNQPSNHEFMLGLRYTF